MAQLAFLDGPRMGGAVPLRDGLSLSSAVFRRGSAGWSVAASSLRINGASATDAVLRHGDVLTLGDATLVFRDDPAPLDLPDSGGATRVLSRAGGKDSTTGLGAAALEELLLLATAVHSSLQPDEVGARLLDQLVRLLAPDRCFLLLADDHGRLAIRAERGAGDGKVPRAILDEVAEQRRAVRSECAILDPRWSSVDTVKALGLQSLISAPMTIGERLIGVLHLDRVTAGRPYSEDDLALLAAAAGQAALAIDHARTHERELAFGRRMARMSEAARRLAQLTSEQDAVRAAVEEACRLFECTKASLLLFDAAAGVLRMAASNCVDPALWSGIGIRPGDGLAGRVFADARPAVVDAVSTPTAGRRYSTDSFAIAPVVARAGTRPLGVLTVTDKSSREAFSARDEGALALFAAQAAVALDAARFFERTTADALTRIPARAFFDARLEEEVRAALAAAAPLALLVADVDNLKDKNEIYGRETGDRLLRETASLVSRCSPAPGLAARIGGEEFATLLPGLDLAAATSLAKDLRLAVERFDFNADRESLHATVSIGLAVLKAGEAPDAFLKRAEQAVYMAKKNGRNRVESAR